MMQRQRRIFLIFELVNYSLDCFKQSQHVVLGIHCLLICTCIELALKKFGALTMDQILHFLQVLIEYAVTFDVGVNLSVQNHFEYSCVIVIRCSRHGDIEALGVSIDERMSPPYLNSAPTYSAILLIAVMYLSACLLSLQSKMQPSRSEDFSLNFCYTDLLFWFSICPDRDRFERSPLLSLPAPFPAPLPPPLPYADFTGLGLMSDMTNFLDAST